MASANLSLKSCSNYVTALETGEEQPGTLPLSRALGSTNTNKKSLPESLLFVETSPTSALGQLGSESCSKCQAFSACSIFGNLLWKKKVQPEHHVSNFNMIAWLPAKQFPGSFCPCGNKVAVPFTELWDLRLGGNIHFRNHLTFSKRCRSHS